MQIAPIKKFFLTVIFGGGCIFCSYRLTSKLSVGGAALFSPDLKLNPVRNVSTLPGKKGQSSGSSGFPLPRMQDDLIVVGRGANGRNWTLGDVRRIPVHEENSSSLWIPLKKLPKLQAINIVIGDVYPSSRNRSKHKANILVYNRVPKCASTAVQNLIGILRRVHSFDVSTSGVYWSHANSIEDERNLVDQWRNVAKPLIYDKHMYFIDVSRYDENIDVNWMNVIRHPINRFISAFHYLRSKERWAELNEDQRPNKEWFNKDISRCVELDDPECEFAQEYLAEQQLTYFCGSAPECRQMGNEKALNVAKYNAERFYSVIGIVEEFQKSLAVFQAFLPRFFDRSPEMYLQYLSRNSSMAPKARLTLNAIEVLKMRLAHDIDFYHFAKQRLEMQSAIVKRK